MADLLCDEFGASGGRSKGETCKLLVDVYNRPTEWCDTADLKDAKALLVGGDIRLLVSPAPSSIPPQRILWR